uniref:Uncharacterized protein n=1 Tax=viral metagenome TaxID=1070528 RepID=A0A6H1ZXP2_9ZZZZ
MRVEIETVAELRRLLQPFMGETRIVLDYGKTFYIEYVLPTNSGAAYLKIEHSDGCITAEGGGA